jgi:hypothetical protein
MKYVSKIKLSNSAKFKRMIVVEPWAEVFELLPGQTLELIAQSENEGEFEIDFDGEHEGLEYTTIYAWYGCTIEVLSEGENLSGAGHIAAFTISSGLSLSEFTKKIFGRTE